MKVLRSVPPVLSVLRPNADRSLTTRRLPARMLNPTQVGRPRTFRAQTINDPLLAESQMRRSAFHVTRLLFAALAFFSFHPHAIAADPGRSIVPQLQERFGLSEAQVRGALGALLVFVRERLPKPEFDEVSKSIPNANYIMHEAHQRGIVTAPLDDIGEYQDSLASLGIGQPLASQFAPAVVEYLGAAGFHRERRLLARVLD